MIEGERVIQIKDRDDEGNGVWCMFNYGGRIGFWKGPDAEECECLVSIDPAMMSVIYGAYMQMEREVADKRDGSAK